MRRAFSSAAALILLAMLSGCNPGPSFTTDLSLTRGLRKGDPVTHNGDKIGTVEEVRSLPDGKYEVRFTVQSDHARDVRRDSIAALRGEGGPPHLEILTPNPDSPPAPPDAKIAGAATPAEEALLQGSGQLKGLAGNLATMLQTFTNNLEGVTKSPAWEQFHQDLDNLQRQVAQAGEQGAAVLNRELPRLETKLSNLQQQLIKEGKSAEAQRLRRELDNLARGLVMPTPKPTPNPGVD